MDVKSFVEILNADFYTGVPDSQLRALCDYLVDIYGIDKKHHIVAANEGNSVALAAGYYLATGKVPVVYLQNSGEGNIINPVASLLNEKVYAIPMIFVIGWRGEPGVHDEPQHVFQGEITLKLLEDLDIEYVVVDKNTSVHELSDRIASMQPLLKAGQSIAFVIKKDSLTYEKKVLYKNDYELCREDAITHIVMHSRDDLIISTTGKISRELFEIREKLSENHANDFLTVGSMGHCSSIALGVAINAPNRRIWCIDGDGALLMHMGAMAVIGSIAPDNMVHIVLNNSAHDTVGGMPTVIEKVDLLGIAKSCGYKYVSCVDNLENLDVELIRQKERKGLSFIEVKCALGSRKDLGRPTTSTIENKNCFSNSIMMDSGKGKIYD